MYFRSISIVALCIASGCWFRKTPVPTMEILLNEGIRRVVRVGDLEGDVHRKMPWKYEKETVKPTSDSPFSHYFNYSKVGIRVYFSQKRVEMIEIQEPFHGTIQGYPLEMFVFDPLGTKTWDEVLIRKLGTPRIQATAGGFGGEGFFYDWGDIYFDRRCPYQMAIYRNDTVSRFRQREFVGNSANPFKQ